MGFCCTTRSPRTSLLGSHGRGWHHKWLPALCLQRGHAAGTVTILGGLSRASVPFLNSKARFFPSSLDAPHLCNPVAHTFHSCTVLPHQRPWPCLTQQQGTQDSRAWPRTWSMHCHCSPASSPRAQLPGTPHPKTSGDSAAVVGMWEATGQVLPACPRHINLTTWGKADREGAQPSWNAIWVRTPGLLWERFV